MEKRLKNYIAYIASQCERDLSDEEKARLKAELLTQISFFQHERLVHLIVTVLFAILTIMTVLCSFMVVTPALLILLLLFLILLVPYIRHYYILENGVQKLYEYYDKLV